MPVVRELEPLIGSSLPRGCTRMAGGDGGDPDEAVVDRAAQGRGDMEPQQRAAVMRLAASDACSPRPAPEPSARRSAGAARFRHAEQVGVGIDHARHHGECPTSRISAPGVARVPLDPILLMTCLDADRRSFERRLPVPSSGLRVDVLRARLPTICTNSSFECVCGPRLHATAGRVAIGSHGDGLASGPLGHEPKRGASNRLRNVSPLHYYRRRAVLGQLRCPCRWCKCPVTETDPFR